MPQKYEVYITDWPTRSWCRCMRAISTSTPKSIIDRIPQIYRCFLPVSARICSPKQPSVPAYAATALLNQRKSPPAAPRHFGR
jgi:poly-beta-hydroxyalkanoate depolymerase